MTRHSLVVRLGTEWSRFTYDRDDLELLGTVQRGAQIGALARLPDGTYVQANGDWFHPLSLSQVNVALKQADRPSSRPPRLTHTQRADKPVVVVRKKRRIASPGQPPH